MNAFKRFVQWWKRASTIKRARKLLERVRWSEEEILTTLGELDIGENGIPIKVVACKPGCDEPLVFWGTAICHSMLGDGDVLVELNSGGYADLSGATPCLKQPFSEWLPRLADEDLGDFEE